MFKKDHIKTKITAFILLNILLSAVFFIISSMPDSNYTFMFGWHFHLLLVWYPVVSAAYGCAVMLTGFGDWWYRGLMAVIFLAVTLISAVANEIMLWPGALILTGIMLGAAILTGGLMLLVREIVKSYRNYKQAKEKQS